ncbi:MAG TPA: fibronectin type III domain-containing protein, partial [Candidatus Levybacteria bacterium]|nr:fibronectin type III domain-containing protein [Candidatus Levybacteria bacterium]
DFVPPTPTPTPTPTSTPPPQSNGSSPSQGTPSNPGSCELSTPGKPDLFRLAWNSNAVTLYFSPVSSTLSYVVSYGRTQEANEYAQQFTVSDNSGVILHTVGELQSNTQYFFKVRAMNECRPGDWSGTLSTRGTDRGVVRPTPTPIPSITITPIIDQDDDEDAGIVILDDTEQTTPTPVFDNDASESGTTTPPTNSDKGQENPVVEAVKGIHDSIMEFAEDVTYTLPAPAQSILLGISTVAEFPVSKAAVVTAQISAIGVGALVVLPKTGFDLFTSLSLLRDLPFYLTRMIFSILQLFGLRKRVKPWGVVFDATNGQPIDPAVVTLFQKVGNKTSQIGMKITDMAGRFGFLVQSGEYTLFVKKTDYLFPSKLLSGQSTFRDYKNLYFGGELTFADKDLVTVNIPLDPVRENWNQKVKDQYYKQYQQLFKEGVVNKLMMAVVVINVFVYVLYPSVFNLLMLLLAVILLAIRKFLIHKKSWGVVYDKKTRKVLSGVTVKAVKSIAGKDLDSGSVMTDASGRYYMLLSEGEQYLQVEQTVDGVPKVLKKIGPFKIKKEAAFNPDISI